MDSSRGHQVLMQCFNRNRYLMNSLGEEKKRKRSEQRSEISDEETVSPGNKLTRIKHYINERR